MIDDLQKPVQDNMTPDNASMKLNITNWLWFKMRNWWQLRKLKKQRLRRRDHNERLR